MTCLLYTSDAADEMRGCLVGSEMCIRDSPGTVDLVVKGHGFVEDGQMILDSKSN